MKVKLLEISAFLDSWYTGKLGFPGKLFNGKIQLSWKTSILESFLERQITGNFCFPGKLVFWKTIFLESFLEI